MEWEGLEISFKVRDNNKGTFHAKVDTIKKDKQYGLTQAEDIK